MEKLFVEKLTASVKRVYGVVGDLLNGLTGALKQVIWVFALVRYMLVLGKPETASSRLNLTQAFNSLGTTLAPVVGGVLILNAAPFAIEQVRQLSPHALHLYRMQQAASVKMPKIEQREATLGKRINDSIWKHPNLLFGALGLFAYAGAEVSIGSFMVSYFGQPDIAGFSPQVAAGYVSFYWGGAMVGRLIGAAVLQRSKTQ